MMSDRIEESRTGTMADCEQSDFIVKFYKTLNYDLSAAGASSLL